MKNCILEVQNLSVQFKTAHNVVHAVRGIDLEIERGVMTSLVGESGSGKSVTALSLTRLIKEAQVSGAVIWNAGGSARNLLHLPEINLRAMRGRDIAYVLQDPFTSLDPLMKISDQLREAIQIHTVATPKACEGRMREVLDGVKLSDGERILKSYPHELSGGMNQRVAIAMALINSPKLLIADEPTTALDVTTEYEIMKLLGELRTKFGLTILFITHNLPLALRHSEKVIVMENGKIADPDGEYARRLFQADLSKAKPKTRVELI